MKKKHSLSGLGMWLSEETAAFFMDVSFYSRTLVSVRLPKHVNLRFTERRAEQDGKQQEYGVLSLRNISGGI